MVHTVEYKGSAGQLLSSTVSLEAGDAVAVPVGSSSEETDCKDSSRLAGKTTN